MLFIFTTYVKMLKDYWNLYSFSPWILYTEVHVAAARVSLIFVFLAKSFYRLDSSDWKVPRKSN